jgi:glycosyltransferase involved in cell wall biosynthesis
LQELTQQLGIDRQVHFTGPSSSVPEILVDCDAFVLASRNEAMPVSILEAMASSLPVVATDVGSVREVVVHGKTGLVVPPEDPAALGAALRNVMMDEKLARAFGAAGRERVERCFSLEQQVDRYLSLYRGVCH